MLFQNTPIQRKLMTIIFGTSSVVLLLTCAAFLGYEFFTYRQTSLRQLSTLGEIIASNSTAVLAFDNREDAAEVLSAVKAERHIVAASLYDKNGVLFARYPASLPESDFPSAPLAKDGYRFSSDSLEGFTPVIQVKDSERFGTLYLKSDMQEMYARLRLYIFVAGLIIVVLSLVAYALSRKLLQQISRPILALAETAHAVSDRQDYSVRASKFGEDETGILTDAFNHMLEQIQTQNLALQKAYDDLRQTQVAIMQQERLRALGQMASGIAHDINNALSPASLYVDSVLERETHLTPRSREYLTTVQRAIDDVAQTVSRLREFYRQPGSQPALTPVNLNRLVEQVIELTRARWGDITQQRGVVIEVRKELSSQLLPIVCVENEIREALTNLVFNAVDAMPAGGTITVRTRLLDRASLDGGSAATTNAIVEVADTGLGMDEETRRRCLEPFYTTKGERGTGLGLAMVYGTLQRHGGQIEIESAPGAGTTMRLLFPLSATAEELAVSEIMPAQPTNGLRLLLVDDDEVLLKSLGRALEDDGHTVITAPGGQAGIDAFATAKSSGQPFDAVITDLGMPAVDGRRVAEAVKTLSPQTPVFLLTGWGQRMKDEGDMPAHVDQILNKPPKLRDLRDALAVVRPRGN